MKFGLSILKHTVVLLLILGSSRVFSQNVSDLQDIEFDVARSFQGMNTRTGKTINISTSSRNSVKIVGENNWAYLVKISKAGQTLPGTYFVDKKWARRALNLRAARYVHEMNRSIQDSTNRPKADCCDPNIHHNPEKVTIFDELETSPKLGLDEDDDSDNYLPGCQALEAPASKLSKNRDALMKCVQSIQDQITKGSRNSRGQLLQGVVFKNLYKRLNPKEQRFASLVFTAQGEAIPITRGNPPQLQEMSAVMKVIENRMNSANEKASGEKFNQLDVILDPLQFSMYNRNANVWKRVLDPGQNENLETAVDAFIEYENADFEPKPEINEVYHYHANYVRPDWAVSSRELRPRVNGELTRAAPAGYNERTLSGRSQIQKSYSRIRHIFYRDITWSRRPQTPWRD